MTRSPLGSLMQRHPFLLVELLQPHLDLRAVALLSAATREANNLLNPHPASVTSPAGRRVLHQLQVAARNCLEGVGVAHDRERGAASATSFTAEESKAIGHSFHRAAAQAHQWQRLFRLAHTQQVPTPCHATGQRPAEPYDASTAVLVSPLLLGSSLNLAVVTTQWSASQLRHFLHAFSRLQIASVELARANAQLTVSLLGSYEKNRAEVSAAEVAICRTPLPFLLPWPIEGGAGDEARTQLLPPVTPRRPTAERVEEWEVGECQEGRVDSQGEQAVPRLFYGADEQLLVRAFDSTEQSAAAIAHLSSTSLGCPWPLTSEVSSTRSALELRLLGCRLLRQLGVADADAEAWTVESHAPQRRAIHASEAAECEGEWPPVSQDNRFWSDWFRPVGADAGEDGRQQLPDDVLRCLSRILEDSLVFAFGSECCQPWPRIILAPLAPGWIGGFISGACE